MSDLVGNPEDQFSHVAAHFMVSTIFPEFKYHKSFGSGEYIVLTD